MWYLGGYEIATWTTHLYIYLSAVCSLVHFDSKKYPGTCPDRNAPPQRPGNMQNIFRFAVRAASSGANSMSRTAIKRGLLPDPERQRAFFARKSTGEAGMETFSAPHRSENN